MSNYHSKSEEDTIEFAKKIARQLHTGDILVLTGDLGSGKTKFTQGILCYFNLENEISSPTFTIVNEYIAKKQAIYHFDVYRLSDLDEFYAIGGEEYFKKGICIIEWGEIIREALPNDYIEICFSQLEPNENERNLEVVFHGDAKLEIK